MLLSLICFSIFSLSILGQSFPNISTQIFGPAKYEIAADGFVYGHGDRLNFYFKIINISDSPIFFECPDNALGDYRVTLRDREISYFSNGVLPVIRSVNLGPGEAVADTYHWITTPAVEDTVYQLWGILNVGSWSPFPKDSLYLEFSMGSTFVSENPQVSFDWARRGNPFNNSIEIPVPGEFEILDLSGRSVRRITAPYVFTPERSGIFLIKSPKGRECAKIVIIK